MTWALRLALPITRKTPLRRSLCSVFEQSRGSPFTRCCASRLWASLPRGGGNAAKHETRLHGMATRVKPQPASAYPTGAVTFVFTDIEGSTQRWDRDRGAMQDAVRRHDALMRRAIAAHDGYVFKTVGDAFCAA